MKNTYWVAGQVLGPNFIGAFGQSVTVTNGVLMPEHLASDSAFHDTVRSAYPEHLRPALQIVVTSIYKFEDSEDAS